MQKIIGYHGTKERFVDSIINDSFKIATPQRGDNHWLGHGIYFYSDYELAEWWARTKVTRQNKKYGNNDVPIVIRGVVEAENVWDLDNPYRLEKFKECQIELEKQFVCDGVRLNFSNGNTPEKIRCFWMDAVKEEYNIDVIIYTFTKENPSYVDSRYHVHTAEDYSLGNMGLAYHEKQICVTNNQFIVDKSVVYGNVEEFDEEII